jgi:putative phosphoesterase
MEIAIVSDSHGRIDRLQKALQFCKDNMITNFIHAGDFAVNGTVKIFKEFPNLQIKIARGNFDVDDEVVNAVKKLKNIELNEVLNFKVNGICFQLTHKPENLHIFENPQVDIFIHGHTHKTKFEKLESQIIINPGALIKTPHLLIFNTETMRFRTEVLEM